MKTRKIKKARETMREALKDENLRIGYIANIAMVLYDNYPLDIIIRENRNEIAEKILKRIFD